MTTYHLKNSIHEATFSWLLGYWETTQRPDIEFTYTFENLFHPYVGRLIEELNRKSVAGMLDPAFHKGLDVAFFDQYYDALAVSQQVSFGEYPRKNIDFSPGGPYSGDNWELAYHIPMAVSSHLRDQKRHLEASRWLHLIFDPTSTDLTMPAPARYWKLLPFRENENSLQIDDLLRLLSKPDTECTADELEEKERILAGYSALKDHPFQPHRIARTRIIAYQYHTVMSYLENLISWGDSLFAQDTIESINEATQRYVLASNILGPRPQEVPLRGEAKVYSYKQLRELSKIDGFSNALVDLEGKFPFSVSVPPEPSAGGAEPVSMFGRTSTLYFCIPRNDKLLGYWDTVADRLFKIRNSLNLQGVFRKLALFEPRLDPGMLAKAAASGIDIGGIVAGLNQPLGPVRAGFLLQQAKELAAEVKAFGQALLSAIEKREGEQLALLRQGHETRVQELTRSIRFLQWQQARESTEAILRSRSGALERYDFALRSLGIARDAKLVPDSYVLAVLPEITEENFDEIFEDLVGQFDRQVPQVPVAALKLAGQSSPAAASGAVSTGPLFLTPNEDQDLNEYGPEALRIREEAAAADMVAAFLSLIPDMGVDLHFWGMGGHANIFGGTTLATMARFFGSIRNLDAAGQDYKGATATKTATYERRADDWRQQGNQAARELAQFGRQLIGSRLAEQTAQQEYESVAKQIEQSAEVDRFMRDKFAGEELYGWMQRELSRLYHAYHRLAVDVGRRAETRVKRELMREEVDAVDFIKPTYFDEGRRGLLSGEALSLDLKRLELTYAENNHREFELTRNVSLRQLDPFALLTLKATGSCTFTVAESVFDLENVHYLRRLRQVAVSLPAVVGPNSPLHTTLTLLKSTVRIAPELLDGAYGRQGPGDGRFVDYLGAEQIVTSVGINDSGLFETNLRDERPLPFEGAGAVSTWRIDLPKGLSSVDRSTVSDVVLHFRFTARQGGDLLAQQAQTELGDQLENAASADLSVLTTLRSEHPTQWTAFASGNQDLSLRIGRELFPYFTQTRDLAIDAVDLATVASGKLQRRSAVPASDAAALAALSDGLNGQDRSAPLSLAPDQSVLRRASTDPIYLVIRYHLG